MKDLEVDVGSGDVFMAGVFSKVTEDFSLLRDEKRLREALSLQILVVQLL